MIAAVADRIVQRVDVAEHAQPRGSQRERQQDARQQRERQLELDACMMSDRHRPTGLGGARG
jgi:hypothetical protein